MNSRKLTKSIAVLFVLSVASVPQFHATVFTSRTQILNPARRLNQTGEYTVGTTSGSGGVSPQGAATYSIPIAAAPGTAGVQPAVAITYGSRNANGVQDHGWNLDATTSIVRTDQNLYYDGVRLTTKTTG